ncbi:MAG: helix-turn-helix domain-containing protein [Verrucomicrobiota bacterium]
MDINADILPGPALCQIRDVVREEIERAKEPQPVSVLPPVMTIAEFAKRVGRSRSTVYKWVKEGKVKTNRAGLITAREGREFGL